MNNEELINEDGLYRYFIAERKKAKERKGSYRIKNI